MTYLDYASRWPLRDVAHQAWNDASHLQLGDPQRLHRSGRQAADLLEQATVATATLLGGSDRRLVWTASGTEAIYQVMYSIAQQSRAFNRTGLVVGAVEHSSVLRAAERIAAKAQLSVEIVPVDQSGMVDLEALEEAINDNTLAVHLQHANHEIGTLQPTRQAGQLARDRGALLHVDACQSLGQVPLTIADLGAHYVTASAAKFGGVPGTGFLLHSDDAGLYPLLEGDGRQRGRRAGQVDVAAIAASAVALQYAVDHLAREHNARDVIRRYLRQHLADSADDIAVHGRLAEAHPGIVALSALYVDGAALVDALDREGYSVHSGSSCTTTAGEPSHVLVAMNALTHGHIRVSFGPELDQTTAQTFVDCFSATVRELRSRVGR